MDNELLQWTNKNFNLLSWQLAQLQNLAGDDD